MSHVLTWMNGWSQNRSNSGSSWTISSSLLQHLEICDSDLSSPLCRLLSAASFSAAAAKWRFGRDTFPLSIVFFSRWQYWVRLNYPLSVNCSCILVDQDAFPRREGGACVRPTSCAYFKKQSTILYTPLVGWIIHHHGISCCSVLNCFLNSLIISFSRCICSIVENQVLDWSDQKFSEMWACHKRVAIYHTKRGNAWRAIRPLTDWGHHDPWLRCRLGGDWRAFQIWAILAPFCHGADLAPYRIVHRVMQRLSGGRIVILILIRFSKTRTSWHYWCAYFRYLKLNCF